MPEEITPDPTPQDFLDAAAMLDRNYRQEMEEFRNRGPVPEEDVELNMDDARGELDEDASEEEVRALSYRMTQEWHDKEPTPPTQELVKTWAETEARNRWVLAGEPPYHAPNGELISGAPKPPHGRKWCWYIDSTQYVEGKGYIPAMVYEDSPGYWPMSGSTPFQEPYYWGETLERAREVAAGANAEKGIDEKEALRIVLSSMNASNQQEK